LRSDAAPAWTLVDGGVSVTVRVTPQGGRDRLDGIETLADGRSVLKARVRAAPSDGEANEALPRLLAKTLGVPVRDVTLVAGATSRIKRLTISGDGHTLASMLETMCLGTQWKGDKA
jgi:uncharacterized protein (TIGR00251 family)